MFRRRWSGLPDDPDFPVDLEKLGYFIQSETDEVRSIANPKFYFQYFRTKNERHNDRQRFAFNLAVQEIIHTRLEALDLNKIPLPPPPAASANDDPRYVPIFVSKNLKEADRVVVLFGEALQELGVLAHRVIGGQGGIDKGSVVSLVKDLLADNDEGKDKDGEKKSPSTGIILANTGERWWWPQGQRSLCHRDSLGVKMKSCVHNVGSFDPMVNLIPGSEDVEAHVKSIFERVLRDDEGFVNPEARVQAIAVGEAATAVETYLDKNWELWKGRIDCLAMLGNGKPIYELNDGGFKKFLRERARVYITTQAPLNTPISNPDGNPKNMNFTSYGCPVLSSGETYYVELTLIKAKDVVLEFLDAVYRTGRDGEGNGAYANPTFEITYAEEDIPDETPAWEPDAAGSQGRW